MTDEHVNLLAETLCAAFHSDTPAAQDAFGGPVWEGLSTRQRGNWRRAARSALRAIRGNRHWLDPAPETPA